MISRKFFSSYKFIFCYRLLDSSLQSSTKIFLKKINLNLAVVSFVERDLRIMGKALRSSPIFQSSIHIFCFIFLLLISIPQAMSNEVRKPLSIPVSQPFDLTKATNKLEIEIKIEEEKQHTFYLTFFENVKARSSVLEKKNKFWYSDAMTYVKLFTLIPYYAVKNHLFSSQIVELNHHQSKLAEILGNKPNHKVENGIDVYFFNSLQERGILTPIRLSIYRVNQDEEQKIYDKKVDPIPHEYSWVYNRVIDYLILKPGLYRVTAEVLKDNPYLIGFLSDFRIDDITQTPNKIN